MRVLSHALFTLAAIVMLLGSGSGCLLFAVPFEEPEPGVGEPGAVEPGVVEPGVVEPGVVEPEEDGGLAEPDPQPAEPDPQPAEPDPQPAQPDPQPAEPDPRPTDDAGVEPDSEPGIELDGGPIDGGEVPVVSPETCLALTADDTFINGCGPYFAVMTSTPSLLTTEGAGRRILRLHGRFLPSDDIEVVGRSGTAEVVSATGTASSSGSFVDVAFAAGDAFMGPLAVTGTTRGSYGTVWVNIRPHAITLGGFKRVLPQALAGKRLGGLTPSTFRANVKPFVTSTGGVCGAGGDGLNTAYCARTDLDGAVRETSLPQPTTLFSQGRLSLAVAFAGGRVYVAGGIREGSSMPLATVASAAVSEDGSISDVRQEPQLLTARSRSAAVVVGSRFCVVGGEDPEKNPLRSVECADILPGGLGPFVHSGDLLSPRIEPHAVVTSGRLLVFGGKSDADTFVVADTEAATADVFPFTFTGATTTQLRRAAAAVITIDDDVLVIGGRYYDSGLEQEASGDGFVRVNVSVAGTVSTNFTDAVLPLGVSHFGATVIGNYIYLSPGRSAGGPVTRPMVTTLLDDSAFSASTPQDVAGSAFNRAFTAGVQVGRSLYAIGGALEGGDSPRTASVIEAKLGTDGRVLEVLDRESQLPRPRSHPCAVVLEDKVFVLGGREGVGNAAEPSALPTDAFVATIDPAGTLSTFTAIPNVLPSGRWGPRCHVLGDTVFIVAGRNQAISSAFNVMTAPVEDLLAASAVNVDPVFTVVTTSSDRLTRWMHSSVATSLTRIRLFSGIRWDSQFSNEESFDLTNLSATAFGIANSGVVDPAPNESASVIPLSNAQVILGGGYNYPQTADSASFIDGPSFTSGPTVPFLNHARRGHVSKLVGSTVISIVGRSMTEDSNVPAEWATLRQ